MGRAEWRALGTGMMGTAEELFPTDEAEEDEVMRAAAAVLLWCRALLASSSLIRCSMRYWAVEMALGVPLIVTHLFRVPGA